MHRDTPDEFDPANARRRFFQQAAARLLGPLADLVEKRLPPLSHEPLKPLRPPGAIDETRFVDTCARCGKCVEVCPADSIFASPDPDRVLNGTPMVDPDRMACVVCEGLQCTHVCPSGALLPLSHWSQIQMGIAEVYAPLCVRTAGEVCTICVDRCPLGSAAIRFPDAGPPEVLQPGCVGCGVCQQHCPTSPKAIVVRPL